MQSSATRQLSLVTRIIGIDPGLNHTGWGIIEKKGNELKFIACGVISVPAKGSLAHRVLQLSNALGGILAQHQPQHAAIEETFATPNGASTLKLGQARGALLLTLAQGGLEAAEYSALHVKKAVVGNGRAEKQQVAHMVGVLLPASRESMAGQKADASDALAIAICHANQSLVYRR